MPIIADGEIAVPDPQSHAKRALHVEDALILVAVAALFALTVFCRDKLWGQVALGGTLLAMVIVLIRRLRRVNRALTGRDENEGGR
ncbi:MAG: hypothetical protein J7M08_09925 [Planctomycetes bacterium]|nr:hypothetical protein [Planctomycetota bacterium]